MCAVKDKRTRSAQPNPIPILIRIPGQVPIRSHVHNNEQTMRYVPGISGNIWTVGNWRTPIVRLPFQLLLSMMLYGPSHFRTPALQRIGLEIGWTPPPACYCQLLAMSGIGFAFGRSFASGSLCFGQVNRLQLQFQVASVRVFECVGDILTVWMWPGIRNFHAHTHAMTIPIYPYLSSMASLGLSGMLRSTHTAILGQL